MSNPTPTASPLARQRAALAARQSSDAAAHRARFASPIATLRSLPADIGLVSVPAAVRAGVSAEQLLALASARAIELRPESGCGLLSDADRALCLAGPRGSVLSYVRVLP